MKKWIAIAIIILLLIINPAKSNTFNKQYIDKDNVKELNKIELQKDTKYIKYKDNIIIGQNNELLVIDSSGDTKNILNLSKSIESFEISSNSYIDIIDKKDHKVTSINSDGKTMFTDKIYREIVMYKSIGKDSFISVYKDKNKEYIKIQNIEKNLIKEIGYDSKITHLESLGNMFIVVDLHTDKGIYSNISLYDLNGNIKKQYEYEDVIIDVQCDNDSIYVAFENKIEILDKELVKKSNINTNRIKEIKIGQNGQVFVIDDSNKIVCINNGKEKSIKHNSEVEKIESLGDEYITYSKSSIYNKENKEILKSDKEILNIINLNEDTIGMHIEGFMKVLRLN